MVTTCIKCFEPIFQEKSNRKLPNALFTIGELNEQNFWYYYIFEVIATLYVSTTVSTYYCMFGGLILRIINQFDILTNKLKILFEDMKMSFNKNEIDEKFAEIIEQHQKIFE